MRITRTRHGLRLSQHGVVISELRLSAGPTQSVFDLLAALIAWRERRLTNTGHGRIGLLGFAGGGMLAPLSALGVSSTIDTCDLDRASYALFRQNCPHWTKQVRWHHADALAWLRRQRSGFAILVDDLSVPGNRDVIKPAICWGELPRLMRERLQPDGWAVFNLLPSEANRWEPQLRTLIRMFPAARLIRLDEFENRLLVAGTRLPSARELGQGLRTLLRQIRSSQAERFTCANAFDQPPHGVPALAGQTPPFTEDATTCSTATYVGRSPDRATRRRSQ